MYSFTINKHPYSIPALASELTLGQFIELRMLKPDDQLGLLWCLSKQEPEINVQDEKEIKQVEQELKNAYKLIDLLAYDIESCLNSGILLVHPKRIKLMDLDIEIKKNFVNTLPYWGFVHTRQVICTRAQLGKDEAFDATDEIAGIIAHNLYCLVTKNKYNEEKAEEFKEVIYEMSFMQAMQLGNFFLIQQKSLWTSRRKRWLITLNHWRSKLVRLLSPNMGRSIPSKLYQEGIFYSGKKLRV